MEISKEQLLQIDQYLLKCGVKFLDVRSEIVDHFASILEKKLKNNPGLDFNKETQNIHSNFKDNGFKNLLKEKTKSVQKRFYKQSVAQLITFFKLPKILIMVALFCTLYWSMSFMEETASFFSVLSGVLIFLGFRLLFNVNMRNSKKDTFLVLNMTLYFFNIFYVCVMIFNFASGVKNEIYFLIFSTSFIKLVVFVFLLLFYWSGEYVYRQNKKEIQKQYPNCVL
jgi:glucan phosphoethanolaminetransferase (alkaline phosphatase superfamily)